MFKASALLGLLAIIQVVSAQQGPWQQCGGIGWTGGTTCVSGHVCTRINDWYFQCIPSSQVPTTTQAPPTTTRPATTVRTTSTSVRASSTASQGPVPSGNPYDPAYSIVLNPLYTEEVNAAANAITNTTLAAAARRVANIPTFYWLDVARKVPVLGELLASVRASGGRKLVQIVIYDLPDRDCAAAASNGEYSIANGGEALYKKYIDDISALVTQYSDIRIVAVVEPDSLANMVTNMGVAKCSNAAPYYRSLTSYAISKLQQPNIYLYLDAGHAGWLGWPDNISRAATLFGEVLRNSGSGARVRGLATNVANYNALRASSPDPITSPNPNYDEQHYIDAIAPMLRSAGFPATFIVDQGRSGQQNIRSAWGDWCNVFGAGFGMRPTTSTGSSLIDAIVWVKPGGESDGTSDTSSPRYDQMCGKSSAHKPAPEAGTWFQAFFENLVSRANPAL